MTWKRKRRRRLPKRKQKRPTIIKAGRLGAVVFRGIDFNGKPSAFLKIGSVRRSKYRRDTDYVAKWIDIRHILLLPLLAYRIAKWVARECLKDRGFRKHHIQLLTRLNEAKYDGETYPQSVTFADRIAHGSEQRKPTPVFGYYQPVATPDKTLPTNEPPPPEVPLEVLVKLRSVLEHYWSQAAEDFLHWESHFGHGTEESKSHILCDMEDLDCWAASELFGRFPEEEDSQQPAGLNGSCNLEVVPS